MLTLTDLLLDTRLCTATLESSECAVKTLIFFYDDIAHFISLPSDPYRPERVIRKAHNYCLSAQSIVYYTDIKLVRQVTSRIIVRFLWLPHPSSSVPSCAYTSCYRLSQMHRGAVRLQAAVRNILSTRPLCPLRCFPLPHG